MLQQLRAMPGGIRLFLAYAMLILLGLGLSLRFVVDLAIAAPISLPGLIVMLLLAYTIFTVTLVLQRKQAARAFALGLSTLTLPLLLFSIVMGPPALAIFLAALAALLFRSLLRPEVRTYLSEP